MAAEQHPERFGVGRLFGLTSDAIVAAGLDDQRIVLWNPAAAALFGYNADDALGMRLDELVPPDLRAAHLEGIARYAATGTGPLVGAAAAEVAALTRQGDRRDISLSLTDLGDTTGQRVILAIIRDVTAQREAERSARRLNSMMRDFVAVASHDLRSPLTAISGFADLAATPDTTAESRSRALDIIKRSAARANRLVDDLLTLSQIEAGALPTNVERVAVREVTDEALRSSRIVAENRVEAATTVVADGDQVRRILDNYLTNAARYGRPPITVDANQRGPDVTIRVCDHGTGLEPDLAERLFVPFSAARSDSRGSTGLGLSIVRGLARANGGDAFYERTPDGVCFGVTLPSWT